jgi:hypothetical protein
VGGEFIKKFEVIYLQIAVNSMPNSTKKIKRNVRSISLKIIKKKVLTFQAFRNHLQKNKKQNVSKMFH